METRSDKAASIWILTLSALLLVLAASLMVVFGTGVTVESYNNHQSGTPVSQARLARLLSTSDAIPKVTDEQLQEVFEVLRRKSIEGDITAAAIIVAVAQAQRQSEAEPTPSLN